MCILDVTPPEILSCPPDMSRQLPMEGMGSTVSWEPPSVRDNSDMPIDTQQSHQMDFFFTLGTHEVTYNFTDTSGNLATCRFTVTIDCEYSFHYDLFLIKLTFG